MDEPLFDLLETQADSRSPTEVLDLLIETLENEGRLPLLFEAHLMKVRHELGLPLLERAALQDYPPDVREKFDEGFQATCRRVGELYLERGDIVEAWPYFRAIGAPEAVAAALDDWAPEEEYVNADDPAWEAIQNIAYGQGVNPIRAFELTLAHRGTCDGITILEAKFPHGRWTREECARRLVRHHHDELMDALKREVERRGGETPEETNLTKLLDAHPDLTESGGCYVDDSHLQSVLRIAATLSTEEELRLATELAEYGTRLAPELQVEEPPPFEEFYEDYRVLILALLGEDVDRTLDRFASKAHAAVPDENGKHFAAEIYVYLLSKVGRHREALDAYLHHLDPLGDAHRTAPSLAQLCLDAGDHALLLSRARDDDDIFQCAAALAEKAAAE